MKRRRMTAIVLVIALLLGLLPASALAATASTKEWCSVSDDGKHVWGNWLIRKEATCTEKGEEYRTCRYCQFEETKSIKKTSHEYGKWKVTREATCSKEGERVRKCKVCKHEDRQKIEKLPHTFGPWTVLQEATCTAAGSREHTCQVCGETVQSSIDKLPHSWGVWEIAVEATDHSAGTRRRVCRVCGTEETEDFEPEGTLHRGDRGDDVRQLQEGLICYGVLNKGGADGVYGKGTERAVKQVQEAEGLEPDGVAWPQTRGYAQHKFGEWQTITKLTRFSDGLRERTCERCGLVERDLVEARPLLKRGDRGNPVRVIQQIIQDIGYDPGGVDGVYGPRLDAAIAEWSHDHDWYYEPGLAKPAVIDRIVDTWTKQEPNLIGVSGPDTPVNLQISIQRDFNMLEVMPGETLKYTYTVTNLGTEDCRLGPLFLSFGGDQNYKSDLTYFRYVGDLIGEVLKAGGANTYTGSFSFTADMDKAMPADPGDDFCGIQVNAWVMGTSTVDQKRWYSNIDWALVWMYAEEGELNKDLVLTGRVLGDREWYTLGETFEFEATLTNNTGVDLNAYITGVGRSQEGSIAITPDEAAESLPAGKTMTKTYSHTLGPEDEIANGKFGFWLEAHGFTQAHGHMSAPSASLWVEVHSPYQMSSDDLVLTRESDVPEGAHFAAGDTWPYRYRVSNTGDVELEDVSIKAFINEYGAWYPLNEKEIGALAAGAHDDLEGERTVGGVHATRIYEGQDENGKAIYSWAYTVDILAEGVTSAGEVVYAKPIRDRVYIDFEDQYASSYRCLSLSGSIVDPKDEYTEGDEVEVEVTLKNLSGMTLTSYDIRPLLGPDSLDDTYDELDKVAGDAAIEAGGTHTQTIRATLTRMWDTDGYHLICEAEGTTEDGSPVESNYAFMPLTILPKDKTQDRYSLPIPGNMAGKLRNGPVPPMPERTLRSLTVVSKPAEEEAYFDGAIIPVQMRLTIDAYDEYDFMGIETGLGDYATVEPWMSETLMPGESYDFTYLMYLDPEQSGWSTRTVSARLKGHLSGRDEFESCEVYPLFRNPEVTVVGVTDKSASLSLAVKNGEYRGVCAAGEQLDIPFNLQSGGNARIDNVKLAWEQREGNAVVHSGRTFLRDSVAPNDSFDMSRKIQIVGIIDAPYEPEYTLKLWLTGVFLNGKGKQEAVESIPVEVPLRVLDESEAERRLILTGSVSPKREAYASGDVVTITLRAENHTGAALEDVAIDPAWPYSLLKDELEKKGRFASLKDGEAAEAVIEYIVSPADAREGRIEMLFEARGKRQDGGKTERSLSEAITLNFDDDPPMMLNLGAHVMSPREVYAPGSKVKVELEWRNGPLTSARFYALGDNSAPSAEYGNEWHSFGHGLKGYKFYEESNVEAIMGWHRREVTLEIPEDFQGDVYHAAWAIEGDAENYSGYKGVVRSNVATVDLPIGIEAYEGDESLSMGLYTSTGNPPTAAIGEMVVIHALLTYKGGALPEKYTVRYRPVGSDLWSIVNKQSDGKFTVDVGCAMWPKEGDMSDEGWLYEFEAFDADRPELAAEPATIFITWTGIAPGDGLPGDEPVPDWVDDGEEGPDGLPGDEPVPDWVDDGEEGPDGLPGDEPVPDWVDAGEEEPGAPLDDVALHVELLTPCPNPETGDWYGGEEVQFAVSAYYNGGPEVPGRIEICATDAVETAEPQAVVFSENSSYVDDTCKITLDASHAVNGKCVYDFVAYVYLDGEHVDCYSETVPWVFDMAPSGAGPDGEEPAAYEGPEAAAAEPVRERSLTIVEQTKNEDDYYDDAKIPVRMRLTIDELDDYDFNGIQAAPGDSVSKEPWMQGPLERGESYEFTYTMVLDRAQTGWAKRQVTAWLYSRTLGTVEVETCEVRPPFVPAKVTIEDPNVHIINDNMSYLYLDVDWSKFKDYGYPNSIVNIPIRVSGDGNTTIRNVRLVTFEQLNGEDVYAWGGDVRKKMEPSDKFSMWKTIQIKGTQVGQPKGYKLVMYLTGTITNKKGKQEQIQSLPVKANFKVLDPSDGYRTLDMKCTLEPKKSGYALNDKVNIICTVTNSYGEDLQLARVMTLEDNEPFSTMWHGHGAIGKIPAGETRSVTIPYTIRAEDLDKERLEIIFIGEAKTMKLEKIWTRNISVTIPIMGQNAPEQLTASASCGMGSVKALHQVPAKVTVTNNADQRVSHIRVFAMGDTRDALTKEGKVWHDCGHGMKGWLCAESGGIDHGDSSTVDVPFVIPTSYIGKDFTARWIVEADLADGTGVVRSNVTGVKLGVLKADDDLVLNRVYTAPNKDTYEVGDYVVMGIQVHNLAGDMPEGLEVDLTTASHQGEPIHGSVNDIMGDRAYAYFGFTIEEADVVDGKWQGAFAATAKGGDVKSKPLECTLTMAAKETVEEVIEGAPGEGTEETSSDGPEGDYEKADGTSEGDDGTKEKETQINWAAVHAAQAAIDAEAAEDGKEVPAEGGATEASDTSEGGEAKPAEGGAIEASEGGEGKSVEEGKTEAAEGKSESGGSNGGGTESTGGSTGGGTESTGGSTGGGTESTGGSTGGGTESAGGSTGGGTESTGGSTGGTESAGGSTGGATESTGGSAGGGTESTGGSKAPSDGSDEPTYSSTVSAPQAVCCMYALAGQGADGATLCETHGAVADAVAELIEGSEDELEAWQQAEALWTEALEAEYAALLADADEEAAEVIEAEKAAFFGWMDALKAESDDPVYAEWTVCGELATQAAALCELRHVAPEAPAGLPEPDDLEAEADSTESEETAAPAQVAREGWISAHLSLLGLMYPDSPETVEAIAAAR